MTLIALRTLMRAGFLVISVLLTSLARAGDSPSVSPTYEWVDLYACKTPKPAPPPLPRETDLVYNVERRFIDLDQNGKCVVMDVWLERFASMPDSISRDFEQRWYRFNVKRWDKVFYFPLEYYPYALRSSRGETFFIQASIYADVGDPVVLHGKELALLILKINPERKGLLGEEYFIPYKGNDRQGLLKALATGLTNRLASGKLVHEELADVSLDIRPQIERERIAMILKAAEESPASSPGR